MRTVTQIGAATMLLCAIASAQAKGEASYPYLLRLEHASPTGHSCALLQTTGAFHLEFTRGDDIRVFEGSIPADELLALQRNLNSEDLLELSQPQIEEPILRTKGDVLQVSVRRGDAWQDLFFLSSDSEQPFNGWLQPLVHWLDDLHKLPHRELSEDEGKNNCLPPKSIKLQRRDEASPSDSLTPRMNTNTVSVGPTTPLQPQSAPMSQPRSVPALLRVFSTEMLSDTAHESCVLIGENGIYRAEDRNQKVGKPVKTKITSGRISPDELDQLHQILNDPVLAAIEHREPPGAGDIPVMGNLLEITVARDPEVQHIILSSRFNRPYFPGFYQGDADRSAAQSLLKFLDEHVENNPEGVTVPGPRNHCSEAP